MHRNEELVRHGFTAFDNGDMAALDQLIADDVVWVVQGTGPISGRFEGKAALFSVWATIPGLLDGPLKQEVVEVFSDDEVAVAVTETTAERRGRHLERARGVIVFVIKDQRVAQGRVIAGDPVADEEFWAG